MIKYLSDRWFTIAFVTLLVGFLSFVIPILMETQRYIDEGWKCVRSAPNQRKNNCQPITPKRFWWQGESS